MRLALEALQDTIPALYARMSDGLPFIGHGPSGKVSGHIRDGEFHIRAHRTSDGTIWQPTPDARRTIETMLVRSGEETPIAELLVQFDELENGKRLKFGDGLEVIKQPIERVEAALTAPLMSELVPIKMAYEFLALHIGAAIYEDKPPLQALRAMLQGGPAEPREVTVERLFAPQYLPMHGLAFENNDPYVRIQVRLFGKLAYRVHFRRIHITGGPRGVYTLDLRTGNEDVGKFGDAAPLVSEPDNRLNPTLEQLCALVEGWAAQHEEIKQAWIFGSRVSQQNRTDSDLDVAVELTEAEVAKDADQAGFNVWLDHRDEWTKQLSDLSGLRIDLQQWHATATPNVVRYVRDGGRLAFQRANTKAAS